MPKARCSRPPNRFEEIALARPLPPLVALRAFEAVGRTGSVRAAGEELAVSHTVVSRHVRHLEARLGIKLLETRGRRLVLTPDGARFHAQIEAAFEQIARATAALKPGAPTTLSIWSGPGIAARRLLPRLPELEALLPAREIMLQPTLARPDWHRREADAEIAYLDGPDRRDGVRSELIARPRLFPVVSPALRAAFPNVGTAADLLAMPLLHEESTDQWMRWFEAAGLERVPPLRGARLWHAHLAMEAARLGQGVALAIETLVGEEIATGALVEVVPSDVRLGGYYLVAPAARWGDPDLNAVRAWVATVFGEPAASPLVPFKHQSSTN